MDIKHTFFFDGKTTGGLIAFPIRAECLIEVSGFMAKEYDDYGPCGASLNHRNKLYNVDLYIGNTAINDIDFDAKKPCPFYSFVNNAVKNLTLEQMDIDEYDLLEEVRV